MSDQDRGAYTPPREPPLQFDARRARDAQPMPMALIGSGAVLVVLLGGVIAAYTGVFSHKDAAPKTVGERVVVMKTAPVEGQQVAADPAAKLEVFSDKPAPASPVFTPDPEKPAPRPTLQVRPSSSPPVHIAPAEESVPKPTPARAVATTPTKAAATPVAATDLSTAHGAIAVAPKATPAKTVAAGGSAGAQIGAFSSRELAEKGFADVGRLASIAGRGKRIEAVEHGDSTLYRTTVTGFADRDAAKAFCAALAAKGHACIVKG